MTREITLTSRQVTIEYLISINVIQTTNNLKVCNHNAQLWNSGYLDVTDYRVVLDQRFSIGSANVAKMMASIENEIYKKHRDKPMSYYNNIVDVFILADISSNLSQYARYFNSKLFPGNEHYITSLSLVQKFPEVFFNSGISEERKDIIKNMIVEKRAQQLDKLGRKIVILAEKTRTIPMEPTIGAVALDNVNLSDEIIDMSELCSNDISSIIRANLVIYKEGDKVYCFNQNKLKREFLEGKIINPFTGVQFEDTFVNNIVQG